MTNQTEISNIAKETVYVLEYFDSEFIAKIPSDFVNNLKKIAKESDITIKIDRNKKLKEQSLLEGTKDLIALIYYSYVATEEQKKELIKLWNENELLYQEELREKYNPNNIFQNRSVEKIENMEMIEYKRNIFQKIWDKMKYKK